MQPHDSVRTVDVFITTFARIEEFVKATSALKRLSLPFSTIAPDGYSTAVDVPAIIVDEQARRGLYAAAGDTVTCAGWIEYRPSVTDASSAREEAFPEDLFGKARMMVVQPCVAAPEKIRFVAHLTCDLSPVFPYLNATMPNAFFNVNGQTFTFMDGYRMITAYPQRVAAAKADGIVDAWRVLAMIRARANECWAARGSIEPSYELRRRPPALEIYNRLPKTNCGQCGEKTCLAFALQLWGGKTVLSKCKPVLDGPFAHLKEALVEICAGLGVEKG